MSFSKKKMVALLLLSSVSLTTVSYADTITELENKKSTKESSVNELKTSIDELESKKNTLYGEVDGINSEISAIESQISDLKAQISGLESQIAETEAEIASLEADIAENQKEFEERASVMYQNSQVGYLDIVFSSSDVDDLLSKVSTMKFLTEHDKDVINSLKNDKIELDAKKDELDGQKLALEIAKGNLDSKNSELQSAKASKYELINDAIKKQDLTQEEINKLESEIKGLDGNISKEKSAAEAKKAEEKRAAERKATESKQKSQSSNSGSSSKNKGNGSSSSSNVNKESSPSVSNDLGSGTLGWPVPSTRRVSSGYGYRIHPISGKSSFHMGIDVPAPLGTPIVAAESGTVISASYSGSYGNLMKVQHDNGIVTYYAHLSGFRASVGQRVSKGQTIASMGSTGNSTGSHLHFEVRVNGSHTNPLNYVR
ncbi:murein hydrolase activator EnvC family protein [Miniphocaeibacter massiliensis]|uniref:murein hydrolase activator EnvC family protein n=1 Tax=Miniphocaeibacter massiliensis TaxID=2041841 RepID=UPI000C1C68FB|nr:peptidoglycan DD-metalloendopeptidase family protein [Miniphocaeibacter massiliensis]